ncbi:hypothetical protein CFC21_022516, partial [Triticum aestivum]
MADNITPCTTYGYLDPSY